MAFRFRNHHTPRKKVTDLGSTFFTKQAENNGIIETVTFRHEPDESVLPSLPDPEVFSLEASLASGKNLSPVSSSLLTPSDPVNGAIAVENIINTLAPEE